MMDYDGDGWSALQGQRDGHVLFKRKGNSSILEQVGPGWKPRCQINKRRRARGILRHLRRIGVRQDKPAKESQHILV
jgi:hypothetical protein